MNSSKQKHHFEGAKGPFNTVHQNIRSDRLLREKGSFAGTNCTPVSEQSLAVSFTKKRVKFLRLVIVPWFLFLAPLPGMSQSHTIAHQQLTRENFKGIPDPRIPVAAFSAVHVKLSVGAEVTQLAKGTYVARISDIQYKALFDENLSWWNDEPNNRLLLKHEQGHFDLVELRARELNANKNIVIDEIMGRGDTPEEAMTDLQQRINAHLSKIHSEINEQGKIYDNETDYHRNKHQQRVWNRKIDKALLKNRPLK